ncbi:MAG: sugar phosphate isomerase/epimerase family protein [Spirochaetota bacterium]
MKIAVFTVSTPEYGIDETVELAKKLGLDGVEWRVSSPPPAEKPESYTFERRYWDYNLSTVDVARVDTELPAAAQKTRAAGLEVPAATTYLRMSQAPLDDIRRALSAAQKSGIPNMRTPAPGYDRSRPYDEVFAATREAIEEAIPFAKEAGVRLCFEMHMNTIIPSASAARRLLDGLPTEQVGVIYDPGNLVIEGFEDYRMGLEILGDYLAWVHVKNTVWTKRGDADGHPWKWEWAPLADGMADFPDVVASLRAVGYDGWLSIEDFSNEEPTEQKLAGIVTLLRTMLAETEG